MTQTQGSPPKIFDERLVRLRKERAQRRGKSFFILRCAEDAADRLLDINRKFQKALIIAQPEFLDQFRATLTPDKYPQQVEIVGHHSEIMPSKYDLIISILNLHSINDVPGELIRLHHMLEPDGLFLGSMFGGETLSELRNICLANDEKFLGGYTPRIVPFATHSQIGSILQRAGYSLPVIDVDRLTIDYSQLGKLVSDIRDMGEGNCLYGRDTTPLPRTYYKELFDSNDPISITFEILWMSGWSPHESQQKPLKPGSAEVSLATFLKKDN